jgi:hypothetical protein
MIVTCSKCHTKVQRPTKSLKINAERLGKTLEEYLSNYLCRKCSSESKKVVNENITESKNENVDNDENVTKSKNVKTEDAPKTDGLYTAKLCLNCVNSCKISVITPKAIITCPRFSRKKDNV